MEEIGLPLNNNFLNSGKNNSANQINLVLYFQGIFFTDAIQRGQGSLFN